jgi:hypothetical protein
MKYLQRLVERATGAPAPVIARAPRPDAGVDDPFAAEPELATIPASRPVAAAERELVERSSTSTIFEHSTVERVRDVETPASTTTIVQAPQPALVTPRPAPETTTVVRESSRLEVHHHDAEPPAGEPASEPELQVQERTLEVRQVEPPQLVTREVARETREVPIAMPPVIQPVLAAPASPQLPSVPAPIAPPPAPALPVVDPSPPRLVIGRISVEVVPSAPAAAPVTRTVVVRQPRGEARPDLTRRPFGLDQG